MKNYFCHTYFYKYIFLLLLGLTFSTGAHALHIIGGEMTYEFLGYDAVTNQNQYRFVMTVYRDCDSGGGQLDNPANIAVYKGDVFNNVLETSFNVPRQGITNVQPVIPPCADVSAVSNACVQEGLYAFTLSLPVLVDTSYFIVYQRCCRTSQIVNITNPQNLGATYMVELTAAAQALGNSSPTFNNYPPTFICNGFDLDFDHSATDVDGDSLVYEFCNPFHGGGQGNGNGCNTPTPNPPCPPPFSLVNYSGSYTATQPMGGDPLIAIDPQTGLLYGTPNFLGQFVVGICVKEYRNGVLLSTVLRDFQFNVVDCTPTVIANIFAEDVLGPQEFLVERCGQTVITILNNSPQTPALESWRWEFDLGNGDTAVTEAWHATFPIPDYGEYYGWLYLNQNLNCPDSAYIHLIAYPGVVADYSYEWDICTEGPVQITDESVSGASGGIDSWRYVISPIADTLYEPNPEIMLPYHGVFFTQYTVIDADGCRSTVYDTITWTPHPPPTLPVVDQQILCLPDSAVFGGWNGQDLTGVDTYWNFGDGSFSNETSPSHQYPGEGTWTVSLAINTPYDCFLTDTFENIVQTFFAPATDFTYSPDALSNLNNTVYFESETDGQPFQWLWDFGDGFQSTHPTPLHTFQDTGYIPVTLIVDDINGCSDTLTQVLDLVPTLQVYIPNIFAPESTDQLGNDRFQVLGIIPGYKDFRMSIWSRWGDLVFQSKDPGTAWDGRSIKTGEMAERGVYIYQVQIIGPRGEEYQYEGSVTLF
jgi:hypothetical protein